MKIGRKSLFALAVAVLAAFWASPFPDGLDKTAELLGFAGQGREQGAWFSGYCIPWLGTSPWSAACSGIAGVALIYGLFGLLGWLLRKSGKNPNLDR